MLRAPAERGPPPVPVRCNQARERTRAGLPRVGHLSAGVPRATRLEVSRPGVAQASGLVPSVGPEARAAVGRARAARGVWGLLVSPGRWATPLARPEHPPTVAYRRPSTMALKSPPAAPESHVEETAAPTGGATARANPKAAVTALLAAGCLERIASLRPRLASERPLGGR